MAFDKNRLQYHDDNGLKNNNHGILYYETDDLKRTMKHRKIMDAITSQTLLISGLIILIAINTFIFSIIINSHNNQQMIPSYKDFTDSALFWIIFSIFIVFIIIPAILSIFKGIYISVFRDNDREKEAFDLGQKYLKNILQEDYHIKPVGIIITGIERPYIINNTEEIKGIFTVDVKNNHQTKFIKTGKIYQEIIKT